MLELYKNIRNKRMELNMSQDELAKKTGYTSRASISRIEKGEIDLPQSKIVAFAEALNTTPGDLLGWDEETQNTPRKRFTDLSVLCINPDIPEEPEEDLMDFIYMHDIYGMFKQLDEEDQAEVLNIIEMKLKKAKYQ